MERRCKAKAKFLEEQKHKEGGSPEPSPGGAGRNTGAQCQSNEHSEEINTE